jgi:RNA-binding protein
MDLTARQRQHLKGLAHHLKPVVHLGKDGLSDSVVKQIDGALLAHELIKVRVIEGSPLDRHAAAAEVPGAVGAFLVQNIGKILILYRPHPDQPRIALPWPRDMNTEVPEDLAEAKKPRERPEGSLIRSVRVRGGVAPIPPAGTRIKPPASEDERPAKSTAAREGGRELARGAARGPARRPSPTGRAKPTTKPRGPKRGRRGVERKR